MSKKFTVIFHSLLLFANISFAASPLIGAGLDGYGDFGYSRWFVDAMKFSRPFGQYDAAYNTYTGPVDATTHYPTQSFGLWIMMGVSPVNDAYMYGTYKLSFNGQATISSKASATSVSNVVYNGGTGITTADINFVTGQDNQIVLNFANPVGVNNMKMISPGYPANTTQLVRNEWVKVLQQFNMFRMMDWLDTNNNPAVDWADRHLNSLPGKVNRNNQSVGCSWEDIAKFTRQFKKDVWINIPLYASDDYVTKCATLLRDSMDASTNVYVEYSNEVWNPGFYALNQNKDLAVAEVAAGSTLNSDGTTDIWSWGSRRVVKRTYEISNLFKNVWGTAAINTRVRCVVAGQMTYSHGGATGDLAWFNTNYGAPKNFFWGIANAPYWNVKPIDETNTSATTTQLLSALEANMNANYDNRVMDGAAATASYYGLEFMSYEGGPDTFGPNNLQAKVDLNFDPAMRTISSNSIMRWQQNGGKQYNWFVIGIGGNNWNTQYGTWALLHWFNDSTTNMKYQGLKDAMAAPIAPITAGLAIPGAFKASQLVGYPNNFAATKMICAYPAEVNSDWYLVNAATDGTYDLHITTMIGYAGAKAAVYLNNVKVGDLTFTVNGAAYVSSSTLAMYLSQGLNTIQLSYTGVDRNIGCLQVQDFIITSGPPDSTPPSVPTGLAAGTTTSSSIVLNWTASTDNVGVYAYEVYQGNTLIGTPTTNTFTVIGLTPSTQYAFQIRAKDASANYSAKCSAVNMTTLAPDIIAPSVPTGLTAGTITTSSVALTWNASTDAVGVTGYDVYEGTNLVGSPSGTSFTVTGLASGTLYNFQVRARDLALNYSAKCTALVVTTVAPDVTPPSVPTGLTVSMVTASSVVLNWNASTDVSGVAGYEVYQGATLMGSPTSTSFTVTGLTANTLFSFKVLAKDTPGNASALSTAVTVTTGSIPFSSTFRYLRLNALARTDFDVYFTEVEWMAGATAYPTTKATGPDAKYSSTLDNANAWKAYDGNSASSWWMPGDGPYPYSLTLDLGAGTAIAPTTIKLGVDYKGRSLASFTCEGSNDNINWVNLLTKTGLTKDSYVGASMNSFAINVLVNDITAPTVPVGLRAGTITNTSIVLSWTASTDAVGVTGYKIYNGTQLIGSSATNSYSVAGLSTGTSYNFQVLAYDAVANESAKSSVLSVSTTSPISSTTYRYLKLTINAHNNAGYGPTFTELEWMDGTTSYPTPKLSFSNTNSTATVSATIADAGQSQVWKAFDGVYNESWAYSPVADGAFTGFPYSITLDLGAGNAIYPTALKLGMASWNGRGIQTYSLDGSNNNTNWTNLKSVTNTPTSANTNTITILAPLPTTMISPTSGEISANQIVMSPNPALNQLNLNFGALVEKAELTVLNLQGKALITRTITNTQAEILNVSSLSKGIYLVKIVENGKVTNGKFVKK